MSKPMLLIIDQDTNRVAELYAAMSNYFFVEVATTFTEALHLYETLHLKVRIVLLSDTLSDVKLPEAIDQLGSIGNLPEIIVYSEKENIQEAVSVMKKGVFSYLAKPFSITKLMSVVDQALEEFDIVKKLEAFSKQDRQIMLEPDYLSDLSESIANSTEGSISIDTLKDLLLHPESIRQYATEKPRVLVIEDEEMYRQILTGFLKNDYEVITAEDGKSALEAIRISVPVNIILLDIFLPDISGADLLPQLVQLSPLSQIIVVTAFEFLDIAVKTLKEGACDYINKPFLKDDLLKTVSEALQKQYLTTIFPKLSQKLIQESLSEDARLSLLETLCKIRTQKEKPLYMADLYLFFPELQAGSIPAAFPIPKHLLKKGVRAFVENLKKEGK